jgi:small-conductance mechanosensitive channel
MEMENSGQTSHSMKVSGGVNSGNFSVGDRVAQIQGQPEESAISRIYAVTQEIRELLREQDDVLDESGAQSALDELDKTLADGDVDSRPRRLHSQLSSLWDAVGDAAASALPLAQLAAAINILLQAKP